MEGDRLASGGIQYFQKNQIITECVSVSKRSTDQKILTRFKRPKCTSLVDSHCDVSLISAAYCMKRRSRREIE